MNHERNIENIEVERFNEELNNNIKLIFDNEPNGSKETKSSIKSFIYNSIDPYNVKPFIERLKLAYQLSDKYVKELT